MLKLRGWQIIAFGGGGGGWRAISVLEEHYSLVQVEAAAEGPKTLNWWLRGHPKP